MKPSDQVLEMIEKSPRRAVALGTIESELGMDQKKVGQVVGKLLIDKKVKLRTWAESRAVWVTFINEKLPVIYWNFIKADGTVRPAHLDQMGKIVEELPATVTELVSDTEIPRGSLIACLKRLQYLGLVDREVDKSSKGMFGNKPYLYSLTEKAGEEFFDEAGYELSEAEIIEVLQEMSKEAKPKDPDEPAED